MDILRPRKKPPATLLDLPAEIRNQIYELALVFGDLIRPFRSLVFSKGLCSTWGSNALGLGVGLFRVNRQIHLESMPVLYRSNRYLLPNEMMAMLWCTHVGQAARHLKDIELAHHSSPYHLRPFLASIEHAALNSLTLPYPMTTREAKYLSQLLLPLLSNIREAKRQRGIVFDLTTTLRLTRPCYYRANTDPIKLADQLIDNLKVLLRRPEEEAAFELEVWDAVHRMYDLSTDCGSST